MFNQPGRPLNCFIDIQAGAGGTEACDWASMLLRQYLKYAERKGFSTELEEKPRRQAGIKQRHHQGRRATTPTACCAPKPACTGWCASRSTAPAGATPALPACSSTRVDDSIEIDINPADVRTDTYRASGAGGSTSTRPTRPCA